MKQFCYNSLNIKYKYAVNYKVLYTQL